MKKEVRAMILLTLTAMIWGSSFVVQAVAVEHMGPVTFSGTRSLIAAVFLVLVYFFFRKFAGLADENWSKKDTLIGGICCGIILTVAMNLQQFGIMKTTAGKAGFITTLYIVVVPMMGLFFRHRISLRTGICIIAACMGFYILSFKDDFTILEGDVLVFASAVFFALHILIVSIFSKKAQGILLSSVQFFICGILSLLIASQTEEITFSGFQNSLLPILYMSILSSAVGYTLQVLGIRDLDPTLASLITSLESIFAAIFGWIFLGQIMTGKEMAGAAIVFFATLLAQIPAKNRNRSKKEAV